MYMYFMNSIVTYGVLYNILYMSPSFALLDGVGRLNTRAVQTLYCKNICNSTENCTLQSMCTKLQTCCGKLLNWITFEY